MRRTTKVTAGLITFVAIVLLVQTNTEADRVFYRRVDRIERAAAAALDYTLDLLPKSTTR